MGYIEVLCAGLEPGWGGTICPAGERSFRANVVILVSQDRIILNFELLVHGLWELRQCAARNVLWRRHQKLANVCPGLVDLAVPVSELDGRFLKKSC